MSSKDKEKTLHDRLKQFFRLNKGGTGTIKGRVDISLTREIELEIGPESPIHHRIKVIRELSDAVLHNHLEEHAIEKLWGLTEDLLREDVAREHRHAAFQFLCSLAQGQADKLGMMRVQFFRLITSHSLTDDIGPRLELLRALTDNGKDILYIEEQVAPFLLGWMPAVTSANKTQDLLSLLVNLVKYNAAYVEDSVIASLIQNTCFLCSWSQQEEVVLASLALLDVVVCYAQVPPETLSTVISMLCVNVGNKNFSTNCWKIMRKLLGTHLGHSALLHMCRLLQSENAAMPTTAAMLRGAVFHVSMGMWGGQRVTSLHTTAAAVLPAFVQALRRSHSELVAYEVVLCVRRLVTQSPQALTDPAWDCVLAILEEAVAQAHAVLAPELHGAISDVESQHEKGEFRGDVPRFFRLVESCSTTRPELSVLRLLNYLAMEITPTRPEWLTRLRSLLDQYFWQDSRTNVRVKALDVLSVAVHSHRALYEDELVECVLSLQLQDAIRDKDTAVRNAVVQLLVSLALETESKRCLELLDLIEKFLNQPFEIHELDGSVVSSEAEALDVKSAALGLIKIFQSKTYQLPSSQAIRTYRALVSHLEAHYHQPKVFEKCNATRFLIFKCFLQIRADSLYHIGMPETLSLQEEEVSSAPSSPLRFSSYLAVDHRHGERPSSAQPAPTPAVMPLTGSASPPQSQQQSAVTPGVTSRPPEKAAALQTQTGTASPPQQQQQSVQPAAPPPLPAPVVTHLSLQHACKAVIVCLNKEKDWRVLSLVLRELPRVLQNKALVLARHGNDVEYLAAALCAMVSEKSHNENLRNAPPKFSRSDYQALVLASLGPLASYPLEPALQQKLVKCLQVGLASRCAGACVSALTLCTLEMRDTMYKLLPEVLLNLSKISATVLVAIPILEFLSTLTRLPKVFASFVGDQYMSVFAIALPYTNPFKYNHYTVSLAHHVIAVWFLKCRLPFRRDFVKFIITGLKANVLVPFEEGKKPELVNEDSSSRKRSSSLTEQGSRRREQLAAARLEVKQQPAGVDEELLTFHTELTETCIDLMARHTFSSCAALPRRLGSAEWLLSGGLSMTWLLGHKLVTVTTSGCSQKAIRGGLCDKCLTTCRLSNDKIQAPVTAPISPIQLHNTEPELELTPSRRRHKSATHRSVSSEVTPITPRTKDDLHMGSTRTSEPVEGFFSQQTGERGVECSCWCQGWAEVLVRRPTGNMSWVMRLQNPPYLHASSPIAPDFPMSDISTLFLPSLSGETRQSGPATSSPEIKVQAADPLAALPADFSTPPTQTPTPVAAASTTVARPTSEAVPVPGSSSSLDQEDSEVSDDEDSESRRRNPVRRSNSSPEMSGRPLKSPLVPLPSGGKTEQEPPLSPSHEDKKLAPKQPPTRVSCEAIPEEMGGTTPPTAPAMNTLQSSVSYPGPTKPTLAPTRSAPPPQQSAPVAPAVEKRGDAVSSQQPETRPDPSTLPPLAFRDRGHTISVMSPVRKPDWGALRRQAAAAGGPSSPRGAKEPPRSGVHPSFVFLQLYHDGQLGSASASDRPVLVPPSEMVTLALRTLDYIPPYETHKLGVLYVGPGQAGNEAAILQNAAGSVRYTEFLQGLGSLVRLRDVDSATTFLGGLDTSGNDGKFAYIWQDAMTQVIFHAATLMPTKETDPSCNNKKRHIGNDYVTIVFNESGEDYNVQCIKGQFNFACVVVTPLGHGTNQVSVKAKDVLAKHLGTCSEEPRVISDHSLPTLVRQLALHANLASLIVKMTHSRYASNWLERLRQIKRLRARVCTGDTAAGGESAASKGVAAGVQRQVPMDDFTEYTHYK